MSKWQPVLRGTKMIAFLLTVTVTSTVIALSNSRPTQAESLLYKVGCVVGSLLSYECQKTTPPARDPAETPAEPTPSGGSGGAETLDTSGTSNGATTPAPEPIKMDEKLLDQLPSVPDVQSVSVARAPIGPAYAFPLTRSATTPQQEVLGVETPAAVVPSGEGWKIYGVAWYWWALTLGIIGGAYLGIKAWITKSFLSIVK